MEEREAMVCNLMDYGLPEQVIYQAETAGFSFQRMLALVIKYGPIFVQILNDLFPPKQTIPPTAQNIPPTAQ